MAGRRFGRSTVRAQRRRTDWQHASGQAGALISVPAGATRVFQSIGVTEGAIASLGTIVRIRGCIHIELATETAAVTLQQVGVGIGLFDDRAFAVANAAGLPKPLLDADDEKWMWYWCGHLGSGPNLAAGPEAESNGTGRRVAVDLIVDCKAMRKWDENQTLAWVIENEDVDGTSTEVDVSGFGRMLIKHAA